MNDVRSNKFRCCAPLFFAGKNAVTKYSEFALIEKNPIL
jgi:hypothetical protein